MTVDVTKDGTPKLDTSLLETWRAFGIRPEELRCDERGTLVPRRPTDAPPLGLELPRLVGNDHGAQLAIHARILGKGGMGVVRSATQLPLGRDVAVKTLADGTGDAIARFEILREARVTGALEHPNVVPVYMVGSDPNGIPLIVMKSITGTRWSDLLDESALRAREADVDPLAWHLNVLIQVCNAVHYAHSKGILHRDLKPDNVMIGPFGEVYVLDWGLAISTQRGNRMGLPYVGDLCDVTGTPGYMPPELVMLKPELVSERSDVYLLGAVLHEILTGQVRHEAATLVETLERAMSSEPFPYDKSVPEELGEIANRATAANPADRFPDAEAFKHALDEFLRHRSVRSLASAAASRFEQLSKLLDVHDESREVEIQTLFAACRFGHEEALRQWAGCAEARAGLDAALTRMALHEIEQGDARAASVLIAQLERPPADLVQKLANLKERLAKEQAEIESLKSLGRQADQTVGRRVRAGILALMGVIWTLFYFALGALWRRAVFTRPHAVFIGVNLAYGAFLLLAHRRFDSVLRETRVNRSFVWTLWTAFACGAVLWPVGWWFGVPFAQALAMTQLLYATVVWMSAATLDRGLRWAAIPYVFGFVGTLALPQYAWEAMGLSTLAAMATAAWRWRPET